MTISEKVVGAFAKAVPWMKTIKKAVNANRGQRIFPSRTPKNDHKYNFRLDKGSKVGDKYELILQANKNAEDPGASDAAAKNSHAIVAKILVDPENDPEGSTAADDLLAAFRKNESGRS